MKAKNIEDIYELTPIQQGFLFHNLYAPEAGTYVEHMNFTLKGKLNKKLFWQAWQVLIERHAILRTAIYVQEVEKPLQVVYKSVDLPFEEWDWSDLSVEEQETRYAAFLKEDRGRSFDLKKAPLMRLTLITLDAETYKFAWRFPHVALDGWSVFIAVQEFILLYKAFWHGNEINLPPVRSYRDYVAWWKRQDSSTVETFWREQFDDFTPPKNLQIGGVDHLDDGLTHHWEQIPLHDLVEPLRLLGQQGQLTQNTLFQAAWSIVLGRYLGVDNIVVGSTVTHRPPEVINVTTESMIGPALVTLPTRAKLQPDEPILSWLQQFQRQMATTRDHAITSLVQIHDWSGLPQSVPLIESTVAFENVPDPEGTLQAEELDVIDVSYDGRPHYPLTLTVFPGPVIRLVYARKLFDRSVVIRLLRNLKVVLTEIASHPQQHLKEINLFTPEEQQQLSTYGKNATNLQAVWQQIIANNLMLEQNNSPEFSRSDCMICLLDHHQRQVPIGAVGEVCIVGDNLETYLEKSGIQANTTISFSQTSNAKMYHSGFLASYQENGTLKFCRPLNEHQEIPHLNLEKDNQASELSYVAPRTATEESLVEMLEELLDVESIGVDDNLLNLGMHSLLSTRILIRIRKQWQVDISLRSLFETPTVAMLAQLIERSALVEENNNLASANIQ